MAKITDEADASKIEAHPLAAIFPLLDGEAFEELAADIKASGLIEAGITCEGLLLDGRNRQAACRKVGVPFRTVPYEGSDPLAFVLSKNLVRRHLTTSQRSLCAARLANMRSGARTDLEPSAKLHEVSLEQAAQMLKVSRRSVASGRKQLRDASPELIAAVERGETTVGAAERLMVEEQAAGIVTSHADQSASALLSLALVAIVKFVGDGDSVSEATAEAALAAVEVHPDKQSAVAWSEYLMAAVAFMDRLIGDDPHAVPEAAWDGFLTVLAAWWRLDPDDEEAKEFESSLIPETWPVEREAEVSNGLERIEEHARRAGLPDKHLMEIRLARFLAAWRLGKALNRLKTAAPVGQSTAPPEARMTD